MGQRFGIVTHDFPFRRLDTQDEAALLGHDPAVAIHIADGSISDLPPSPTSHELPRALNDMAHTTGEPRLPKGQLAAVGVAGKVAGVGEVVVCNKPTAVAFFTKNRRLRGSR